MPTFSDIKAEIADDLDDTTGEYSSQIANAVLAAIRYCSRSTYYFNETREETFSTVISQQWYDGNDNANIPTLVKITRLYFIDTGGMVTDMIRMPPEEMEVLSDNTAATGQPYGWLYFGQRIRIYPIPNAVYTIRMQLGPYRLSPLVNDTDENAWLTEAYDLVKARAKYLLFKNTLKDAQLAIEALNDYADQDSALIAETGARNGTGSVRPTCF